MTISEIARIPGKKGYVPKEGDIIRLGTGDEALIVDKLGYLEIPDGISLTLLGLSLDRIKDMKQEILDLFAGEEWVNKDEYENVLNKVFAEVDK